jgi:hypothetical protein
MVKFVDLNRLREIAEVEFADIVEHAYSPDLNQLRIILADGSFVDLWFSLKLEGRYSYHWERKALDGRIYRHDNAPHKWWQGVKTYPKHFHDGSEEQVIESSISDASEEVLHQFLAFIRDKLQEFG